MGYFSNGTEGAMYEEAYCVRCIHSDHANIGVDPPCMVWMAHQIHNYDECNNPDSILHMLIPRDEGGLLNGQCTMFVAAALAAPDTEERTRARPDFDPHIDYPERYREGPI